MITYLNILLNVGLIRQDVIKVEFTQTVLRIGLIQLKPWKKVGISLKQAEFSISLNL